jgi:uncharacterized membrane protein required for colicin V production
MPAGRAPENGRTVLVEAARVATIDGMKTEVVPLNWVDLLTAVVLFVGILRGRKRGMSEELLDTLQWIAIVVVGGLFYQHLAQALAHPSLMSPASVHVASYVLIALTIKLVVTFVKRHTGEKVVGSDLFGRSEYYLGMLAGAARWACVYLFLLNLLHAPYYTREMLVATEKSQEKNFGDVRFPTFGAIQHTFFNDSATGWATEKYLEPILIRSMPGTVADLRTDRPLAAQRESAVNEIMNARK